MQLRTKRITIQDGTWGLTPDIGENAPVTCQRPQIGYGQNELMAAPVVRHAQVRMVSKRALGAG